MSDLRAQRGKKFTKTATTARTPSMTKTTAASSSVKPKVVPSTSASTCAPTPTTSTSTVVTVKTENGNKSSKSEPSKVVDSLIDTFYGSASTKYAAQIELIQAEKGKLAEESLYLQVNFA